MQNNFSKFFKQKNRNDGMKLTLENWYTIT